MNMNRTYFTAPTNFSREELQRRLVTDAQAVIRKIAIHEAGHAAAIYLGNKQKKLPAAFFNIEIMPDPTQEHIDGQALAKVNGGRLIKQLPKQLSLKLASMSEDDSKVYQQAFEADIINVLVGPLAEAKYVAFCDDEPISPTLLTIKALQFYGGASDREVVQQYLESYSENEYARQQKATALLQAAFRFINESTHWLTIIALADFILAANKSSIEYLEISNFLDNVEQSPVWRRGSSPYYPANLAYPNSYQLVNC